MKIVVEAMLFAVLVRQDDIRKVVAPPLGCTSISQAKHQQRGKQDMPEHGTTERIKFLFCRKRQ
jgi:hypothetical protein